MFDAHIHSSMSFDSSVPREDVVAEAVKRGFYGLCFTDHYDVVDSYGKFVSDGAAARPCLRRRTHNSK